MAITEEKSKHYLSTLFRAADLLEQPRFIKLVNGDEFRFTGDPSPLFVSLRRSFLFQMRQSLNPGYVRDWYKAATIDDVHQYKVYRQIAEQLISVGTHLFGHIRLNSGEGRFTVKRNETLLQSAHRQFNTSLLYGLNAYLSQQDAPDRYLRTFEVRNFLSELGKFIEARHTLAYRTPYQKYEAMLNELMKDVDYFARGYPHDILSHDVWSLREHDDIEAILARNEYCSSYAVKRGEQLSIDESAFRGFPM